MQYLVDAAVFARYPGFRRMVVVAEDVDNHQEVPALVELLRRCEDGVRGENMANFKELPALAAWIQAFVDMGLKPNRYPPSVVNLIKRVRNGKPLPYVNSLVAVFNCISLKYLVPCGGDDRDVVRGDLRLGVATGQETYVPLGQPDVLEHPPVGEIIYYDTGDNDVFCRAWCWKNGDRSKLMPETRRAIINVDAMDPATVARLDEAANELAGLLREYTGAKTSIRQITPDTPSFELD